MKPRPASTSHAEALRQHAGERTAGITDPGVPSTQAGARKLVREFQVHRIEVELENAELIEARHAMDLLAQHYTDLYDFAPVGYLTLDAGGDALVKGRS